MLTGLECWAAPFHPESGVLFELGERVRRETPLNSEFRTEEEKIFQGKYNLFITCSWHTRNRSNKVVGDDLDGIGIADTIGTYISKIVIDPESFEILVEFSSGYSIATEGAMSFYDDNSSGYSAMLGDRYWSIGSDGSPCEEPAES